MVQRLVYQSRHSYATKSNQHCIVKTSGLLSKQNYKRSRLPRNTRAVDRAYGGVLSALAVRERIVCASLVEEKKIVKKVLKLQKAMEK